MEDIGAYIFLLVLFGVLFGLPAWLMVRHHKKSKVKLEKLKQEQAKEIPEQVAKRKQDHNQHIATVVGIVAGVLIGSRLLDSVALALLLAVVLGTLGNFIARKKA